MGYNLTHGGESPAELRGRRGWDGPKSLSLAGVRSMTAIKEGVDGASVPVFGAPPQSAVAFEICRGVVRLLTAHGLTSVAELPLPNGRRADVCALSDKGEIWIVEIKSSIEDFRTDQKWPEYRDFSDRLFFAVRPGFPVEVLPEDAGLILADRYGGEIVRASPELRLAGAPPQVDDAPLRARRGGAALARPRSLAAHGARPAGFVRRVFELRKAISERAWPGCAAACAGAC